MEDLDRVQHQADVFEPPTVFERPGCWQRNKLIASLRNLQRSPLVSDGLLEGLNVLLLVVDLLHGLAEVGLQLVVSVVRLCDSVLERHVRVVPVAPHLVRCLQVQIDLQTM